MTEAGRRSKYWLTRPPRPHGDQVADRNVSFLELFYDLVYVAVIGQAAHHLAEHLTPRGVVEFGVVFALIWIAWVNGSLYVELHGRDDGRVRPAPWLLLVGLVVILSGIWGFAVYRFLGVAGWGEAASGAD